MSGRPIATGKPWMERVSKESEGIRGCHEAAEGRKRGLVKTAAVDTHRGNRLLNGKQLNVEAE